MTFFTQMGSPVNEKEKIAKISIFKNPKRTFVRAIEKIIQEKCDIIRLRFVEEVFLEIEFCTE